MIMGTKQYSSATDLLTFSRASGGTALRRVGYGSELSSDTWGAAPNYDNTVTSISASAFSSVYNTTQNRTYVVVNTVAGEIYNFTATKTSGADAIVYVREGAAANGTIILSSTTANYHSLTFKATVDTISILFVHGGSDYAYEDISVKEVIFDRATDPLVLFNHPADVPRIEYDAAGEVKGLLIEEQRTNLLTHSEDFTDASWIKNATSLVTVDAAGPDGGTSAVTLADNNSTGTGTVLVRFDATVATSTPYTFSTFVKAGQLSWVALQTTIFTTPSNGGAYFNLSDGTVGTVGTGYAATIEDVGAGWYRCSITFTTDAVDTAGRLYVYASEGDASTTVDLDGTSSIFIYGSQFEVGGFPSSYIPTTGAAATRSADVARIPTSAFGFNSEAMTVVVDCSMSFDGTNYPRVWEIGSSINNHDRINVYIKADGGNYGVGLQTANVSQGSFTLSTGNSVPTAQVKIAYALREDDIAAVQDGGVVQTNGSGTLKGGNPRTLLALGGSTAYAADYMNGHIKSIQYYPRRLTNAQLQELTT